MRLRRLACLVLVTAAPACLKENLLFDPLATDSGGGSSTSAGSTGMTGETGGPGCPELAPPSAALTECELDALPPFNVGNHPVFAGNCDGTVVPVWARRSVADPDLVEVCDADCNVCDDPNTIDLNDPNFAYLKVSNVLPPPGECARVEHAGKLTDNVCRTERLTLWGTDDTAPRFAAGVDTLDPIPGTGITLELGDSFLCMCSAADQTEEDGNGGLKYPCCVQSPIDSHDVILTPEGGCPVRIFRGPANLTQITTLGRTYDFILHNAYRYANGCALARGTTYWTMTRAAG